MRRPAAGVQRALLPPYAAGRNSRRLRLVAATSHGPGSLLWEFYAARLTAVDNTGTYLTCGLTLMGTEPGWCRPFRGLSVCRADPTTSTPLRRRGLYQLDAAHDLIRQATHYCE